MIEPTLPTTRYADQPVPLDTRLLGLGGTIGVMLIVLVGMFLTWTTFSKTKTQPTLNVFHVAPSAAPPKPVREVPPGPEKVKQDEPVHKAPEIETPKIIVPNPTLIAATPPEKPSLQDPGPPVKDTTAPVSKPAPPEPQLSSSKPTWQGLVLGALDKVKRYPRDARFARQQGVPYIHFVMDRQGKILSVRLERSSGFLSLDREALALPKRAQPLPKPPEDVKGDPLELVVPVEFFMR
ncbi:TonB family protein [Novosphingobium sp. BL-52-GroH]|uniref:TonB family protein n=1 Tax=Novosphingobium sp. BL-52-GroH TaxID=3349877 RepID=UPI00385026E4